MLIVAGWLEVAPDSRDAYLDLANHASRQARRSTGCLEFVQAPDPLSPGRIVVLERWASVDDLEMFRSSGSDDDLADFPPILDADVKRYLVADVLPA